MLLPKRNIMRLLCRWFMAVVVMGTAMGVADLGKLFCVSD